VWVWGIPVPARDLVEDFREDSDRVERLELGGRAALEVSPTGQQGFPVMEVEWGMGWQVLWGMGLEGLAVAGLALERVREGQVVLEVAVKMKDRPVEEWRAETAKALRVGARMEWVATQVIWAEMALRRGKIME